MRLVKSRPASVELHQCSGSRRASCACTLCVSEGLTCVPRGVRAPLVLGGRSHSQVPRVACECEYRGGRSRGRCLGDWRAGRRARCSARAHPAPPLRRPPQRPPDVAGCGCRRTETSRIRCNHTSQMICFRCKSMSIASQIQTNQEWEDYQDKTHSSTNK